MKKLIVLFFALTIIGVQAQEKDPNKRLSELTKAISEYVSTEKSDLKEKLLEVETRLKAKEITAEEANVLKQKYSEQSAERIAEFTEKKSDEIATAVDQIVKESMEGVEDKIVVEKDEDEDDYLIKIKVPKDKGKKKGKKSKKAKKPKRTVDRFVFAVGMNNVIKNGDFSTLKDSNYKMWQSNTIEFGWAWKTRVIETSSLLNFKYGLTFRWNKYSPKNNLYHVDSGDNTNLVDYSGESLDESKLVSSYVMLPVFVEFDFSKPRIKDGITKLRRNKSVRLGLGGYAGLRMYTKQKLEYSNDVGEIETEIKSDYNLGRFKYGLSTYLGYEDMSVFVNYDLNPLFENSDLNNVSLGLRWDW